jgi:hypothetical protein
MRTLRIPLLNLRTEKLGTQINGRTIEICGKCREPGIVNDLYGMTIVFHGVSAILNKDGAIEHGDDICVITPNSPAKLA